MCHELLQEWAFLPGKPPRRAHTAHVMGKSALYHGNG
jgi:hypothetical protein